MTMLRRGVSLSRLVPRYSRRRALPSVQSVLSTLPTAWQDPRPHSSPRFAASIRSTFSSLAPAVEESAEAKAEIHRLRHRRNIGILAHVDAGKTTVTERMLALAGVVRRAGSVDDGNTVTDYLPMERERGITIQSAAISFPWGWHNNRSGDDLAANDQVTISLIDTPGHIDFSVEVSRSVAVLDGAVLVVDAVAGVQAQTETVWRAMTRPSLNNHAMQPTLDERGGRQDHAHEPLPCLAVINKMDKEGSSFGYAIQTLRDKLPGARPVAMQVPLFRTSSKQSSLLGDNIMAISPDDTTASTGEFVGIVDLIHMRAVVWPEGTISNIDEQVPEMINLLQPCTHEPIDTDCQVTRTALEARRELVETLAEDDEHLEELYLNGQDPSNAVLRHALRRATLARRALPVLASAALRGKGIEPVMDAIADLLPSPIDRMAPALSRLSEPSSVPPATESGAVTLGHPLHPSLLALAFKVVHMKGKGGSGDGRVVFARLYSGELRERDVVQVISPPAPGEVPEPPRTERIGGMLELAGGRFGKLTNGYSKSGEVCALIGLKSVVTGDTIVVAGDRSKKKKTKSNLVCLAGVSSPKPVLTVRLEAESTEQQARLSEALALLAIEDPSLVVEETDSVTLLSGLGELHIEVTLDRLRQEFGVSVLSGAPSVSYRETLEARIESDWIEYDRTIGGNRLQGSVKLVLEPMEAQGASTMMLVDPVVTVSEQVRDFLHLEGKASDEDLMLQSELFRALVEGCRGALKRGPLGPYPMANVRCHVVDIDAEDGCVGLEAMPGALRATSAHAVASLLAQHRDSCTLLEPTMSVEITLPNDMVGTVLADLTGRRGVVEQVLVDDHAIKALIRGTVPLVEILGYAASLRSLTGGEGAFTAEYSGHAAC